MAVSDGDNSKGDHVFFYLDQSLEEESSYFSSFKWYNNAFQYFSRSLKKNVLLLNKVHHC